MSKKNEQRSYEDVVSHLRSNGFDVLDAPGVANRIFVKKHGCSAAIEKAHEGGAKLFAHPGLLLGGEIARLVDKGYQKFFKTTKLEVPATADQLKALHQFTEELTEATGQTSLYNTALGTVSDSYRYDRVVNRDEAPEERPTRPWEAPKKSKPAKAAPAKAVKKAK
jgi:hypothetical protein